MADEFIQHGDTLIHNTPLHGFKIESMWAFIAVGEDGDEGLPGASFGGGMMMPLVAADETRVEALREMARDIAAKTGLRIELVRFETRTHVEWIEPKER